MNSSIYVLLILLVTSVFLESRNYSLWEKMRYQESKLNLRHGSRTPSKAIYDLSAGKSTDCPSLCLYADLLTENERKEAGITCLK